MRGRISQRGQVLVVFAGGLVLLLLIGSLVFDLGTDWMMQRQEQNAVDPGALAAAEFVPSDTGGGPTSEMIAAACYYARQNGFFPSATTNDESATGCFSANDPEHASLTVNYPPVGASAGEYAGRPGFVQVGITRQHTNYFMGIIGQSTSSVSASAVAANTTGNANSYSLIALDPTGDCATGSVKGSSGGNPSPPPLKVTVGGAIYVNSSCGGPVSPPTTAPCLSTGSAGLVVAGGATLSGTQVNVNGSCATNGGGSITTTSSGVDQGALQVGDPLAELQPPAIDTSQPGQSCGGGTPTDATTNNQGCGSGGLPWQSNTSTCASGLTCVTLNPGVYYGGWNVKSGKLQLQLNPGIYILAGGGIKQTNGSIEAVTDSSGNPGQVMIFSTDNPLYHATCVTDYATSPSSVPAQCQGPLSFTAQSTLSAYGLGQATCASEPSTCPYVGILMWQDGHGSCPTWTPASGQGYCPITTGGGTNLNIGGTIYAPTQLVNLDGSALDGNTGTAIVQVISWAWNIVGNSVLNMPYNANDLYHLEQRGLVH